MDSERDGASQLLAEDLKPRTGRERTPKFSTASDKSCYVLFWTCSDNEMVVYKPIVISFIPLKCVLLFIFIEVSVLMKRVMSTLSEGPVARLLREKLSASFQVFPDIISCSGTFNFSQNISKSNVKATCTMCQKEQKCTFECKLSVMPSKENVS